MSDLAMLIILEMSLLCIFVFNARADAANAFSKVPCLNRLHCFFYGELYTFHRAYVSLTKHSYWLVILNSWVANNRCLQATFCLIY